ncbi:MAG: crcB-like family protein [Herbaspirillum sp.]|nr:crcB-like family protein [Herbaspirillum sp.]
MNWLGFAAVGVGAVVGAWLRWGLSVRLGALHDALPLGTLLVNLVGGYMIGFLVAFFESHASLPVEWRLLAVTGFLGGLTTFSTFSAESMILLQRGQYLWAFGHSALHLLGALALCFAGFATYRAWLG